MEANVNNINGIILLHWKWKRIVYRNSNDNNIKDEYITNIIIIERNLLLKELG